MGCRFVQRGVFAWAAFAAVLLRLSAAAFQPEVRPIAYSVTRYTAEQGLPHNRIMALLQTHNGYLWVGTLAGLARFDGVKFKVFDMNNTPEMGSDAINALAEDRQDSSLWINTGKELLRYHQHRFERFDEQHGFPHPFGGLWPARHGGLWYSPRYGELVLLRDRAVQTWQLRDPRALGNRIMQVEEDEGGNLVILMYWGLFRFDPETETLTALGPPGLSDRSCHHFLRQTNGTILLAAREGLWQGTGAEWRLIEEAPSGQRQSPDRLCPAADGALWIPWTDGGPPRLARFQAGRSEFVDLSNLPDYPMTQFLEDREGHLWIGTESGLCQLRPKAVQVFAREQGMQNDFVRAVTEGLDGTIWLGTAQGLSGIKNGQVTNLPPVEPPANWGRAEGLLADHRGRVWYGTHANAVAAFERGAWVSPAPLSLGESWVRTLYEDRQGRVWAGFDQGVAWLDQTGAVHPFALALSHPDVRVIHQDRRGDIWFGTYGGGLNRLHDGQITVFATALGEYNNRAWCIHEDGDGVFWVGSRDGLNRFVPPGTDKIQTPHSPLRDVPSRLGAATNENAARFFTFTTQHGLHENTINNVQEDDFGNLWLSGPQGIYRVSRRELNAVAAGRQARVQVLAFGEADGLLNSQCNGGVNQPSGCKDRAGRIWFPTARGVAMIDPRTIRPNDVPPPVVIEQILADERVIFGDGSNAGIMAAGSAGIPAAGVGQAAPSRLNSPAKTPALRLPPGRARVLEIHYTGNSFAAPQRVCFKYQLEGHDRDWRYDNDNRRVAFYTSLRPGNYTFRVTACNNHGVWSRSPAEFSFSLAPYFWQTWLFYVLTGAAVIGLAAAVQTYRLRWQRRLLKLEQQRALADERARIARDLHDDLGTALTGLALQVDVLRRVAHEGPALVDRLAESAASIRTLAERMREVVWAVNPRCDTVLSLASFLEQQAGHFLKADGVHCRLDFPEDIPPLPLDGETRHQLALGVREALANAARHAAASEVVLGLRVEAGQLVVRVADNGRGFCVPECEAHGRGLANMRARLEKVGGRYECRSVPGQGTTIELRVPLKPSTARKPLHT